MPLPWISRLPPLLVKPLASISMSFAENMMSPSRFWFKTKVSPSNSPKCPMTFGYLSLHHSGYLNTLSQLSNIWEISCRSVSICHPSRHERSKSNLQPKNMSNMISAFETSQSEIAEISFNDSQNSNISASLSVPETSHISRPERFSKALKENISDMSFTLETSQSFTKERSSSDRQPENMRLMLKTPETSHSSSPDTYFRELHPINIPTIVSASLSTPDATIALRDSRPLYLPERSL